MTQQLFTVEIMPSEKSVDEQQLQFVRKLFTGMTADQWLWEFRNSPLNAEVYWGVYDNQIAAHYAVISFRFQVGKDIVQGGKAEGSLSDPDIIKTIPPGSNRRVFLSLVHLALKQAKLNKMELIFGFPNKRALSTQVKGGYTVVDCSIVNAKCIFDLKRYIKGRRGGIVTMIRFFAWGADIATKLFVGGRLKTSPKIRPLKDTDASALNNFSMSMGELFPNIVMPYRDWEYLSWRYIENPYISCELFGLFEAERLLGLLVMSSNPDKDQETAVIQDLIARDSKTAGALMGHAVQWAKAHGACGVEMWTMTDSPSHALINKNLWKNGFWYCPKSVKKMIVHADKCSPAMRPVNWHISKGMQRI